MSAHAPQPDRPGDPVEAAYLKFVAAYSDALRAGRTPPRPDLPEPLAARFTRVRPLLHKLHAVRPPASPPRRPSAPAGGSAGTSWSASWAGAGPGWCTWPATRS